PGAVGLCGGLVADATNTRNALQSAAPPVRDREDREAHSDDPHANPMSAVPRPAATAGPVAAGPGGLPALRHRLHALPERVPRGPGVPPPPAQTGGALGRLARAALVLMLLAAFAAGGLALANFCFRGDPPARAEAPAEPAVVAKAPRPPVDPVAEKHTQRIQEAIGRGGGSLKGQLDAEPFRTPFAFYPGGDVGAAAFAGLTLLECGVAPKDPVIGKVAARVRADAPRLTRTYSLAVSVLFLER